MEWPEVQQRIEAGEDRRTECKRRLELRQIGRTICGFANTEGGIVVLGVDDSGNIVGVPGDARGVQERLANFLQNGCSTPVRATVDQAAGVIRVVEATGGRTRTRNEQMANYMLDRQFMEKRGRGWLVMRKAMREFNGPAPELAEDEEARFVTVTFRLPGAPT